MLCKAHQLITRILCEPNELLFGKLHAESFNFKSFVFDDHVETLRIHDVVMSPKQIIFSVQLLVVESIITPHSEMHTNNVVGVARGKASIIFPTRNTVTDFDLVTMPDFGSGDTVIG